VKNLERSSGAPVAVILGAGRGTRLRGVTKGLPKALVDVAGTPALLWIIESLLRNGIRDYVLVVSPLAERSVRRMCERTLSGISVQCDFAVQENPLGPGHAMAEGLRKVQAGRKVLVVLCDTLFDEPLPFDHDWVGIAEARGVGAWCWAESEGTLLKHLYDKATPPSGVGDVLIGLYFFEDDALLRRAVNGAVLTRRDEGSEIQISWAIEKYMESRNVSVQPVDTWVDCGTDENWLEADEKMFRHRYAHEIYLRRDVNGVRVVKDTGSAELLSVEIEWFAQVGQVLPDLVPAVYVTGATKYESQYLEMSLLSSMYLYEAGGDKAVVDHTASLLTTLSERLWARSSSADGREIALACEQMYLQKPAERLAQWSPWRRVCGLGRIVVNGRAIDNAEEFLKDNILDSRLYRGMERLGWIHGDLHFGNILFDSSSKSFRLIDPRGQFGAMRGPVGDIYYDLAKLRHSYAGMYDAILAGLFDLTSDWESGVFELQIGPDRRDAASELDALVVRLGFDLLHVKLVEVGVFLSLISLHKEDPRRQSAFLVRAMQLALDLHDARLDRLGRPCP
jgi:dTDP-glucose pyrophosphorylase